MVFLSVIVLGNKKGTVSSGLGMFLVDALGRYYFFAPFTLVITYGMAYIAGIIIACFLTEKSII